MKVVLGLLALVGIVIFMSFAWSVAAVFGATIGALGSVVGFVGAVVTLMSLLVIEITNTFKKR